MISPSQQLKDAGITLQAVADAAGTDRFHVSRVANGHLRTPYVRRAIAEALGRSYESVWGTPDPGVDRLPPGRRPKRNKGDLPANRTTGTAADTSGGASHICNTAVESGSKDAASGAFQAEISANPTTPSTTSDAP